MELEACRYDDDEWRGFVLVEHRGELLERHVFVTWVAGLRYFPDALGHPAFAPGRELVLRPEPDNPFDPNAIGVWSADGTVQVGHVPAVVCADLPAGSGERHGLVVGEMFHGSERRGLWIVVAREPVTLRVVEAPLCRPTTVAKWVRHAKDAIRHSEEWTGLKSVDPLEQMRQMAATLRRSV